MSDSDEAADGQALAYGEAKKLYQLKPDHELLRYALHPGDDAVWEEFIKRFGKPGISREAQRAYPAIAYLYAMYWLALREACTDPERAIMVNHGPRIITRHVAATVYVHPVISSGDDLPF